MILTERDNLIINVLQQQDFCFYKDIANKFFSSETSASLRLKKLKEKGIISVESIYSSSFNKIMDKSSLLFIGGNKKVIRLNNKYKVIKRKPSCLIAGKDKNLKDFIIRQYRLSDGVFVNVDSS